MTAKYPSPCCSAKSIVRRISFAERAIILRCTKCARLRIEPLGEPDATARKLRLVVSR